MKNTKKLTSRLISMLTDPIQGAWIATDDQYLVVSWNAAAERIYGWKKEEVLGKPLKNFLQTDLERFAEGITSRTREMETWEDAIPRMGKDGTRIPVSTAWSTVRDERDNLIGFINSDHEVTGQPKDNENRSIVSLEDAEKQLTRMKRLYATLSQVNQTIMHVKDTGELFQTICRIAVQYGAIDLAWIGLLEETSGEIHPFGANGLDTTPWPFPVINIHSGASQDGIIATAIRTSRVLTCEDLQTDPGITALNHPLQLRGYRSLAAVPFDQQGRTMGVLNLVSREEGLFKASEEVRLLEEMRLDISFALDTMENEKIRRQWADAFENCAHGIALGSPSSNQIITCNPAFARLQGRTIPEISSMPILDMYAPWEHEHVKQCIAQADQTGGVQYETHMLRKDGSIYPVQMELVSVRDGNGDLLYRVATQQDITERKRGEEALQQSEERFHQTLNNMLEGCQIIDFDWRYIYINAAAARQGHSTPKELLHHTMMERYPGIENTALFVVLRDCMENRVARQIENTFSYPDGASGWFELNIHPVPEGIFILSFDISERKQAEEKLQASERNLNLFVDFSPAAIAMFDRDMKYIVASRRYLADYRLADQMVIGRSHYEVFPEISERWKEIHRRCLAGAIEKAEEDPFPRKDGSLDWVRWEIHPWYKNAGEVGGIILFSEVITERKNTEREIQQRTEDLILLKSLNDAVNRGEDIDGITEAFARETRKIFDCQDVAIHLLSPDGKYLELQGATILQKQAKKLERLIGQPIPKFRIPLRKDSYLKQILANERGTIINDPQVIRQGIQEFTETIILPPIFRTVIQKNVPKIYKALKIHSILTVLLTSSGKTMGLLIMYSKGQFSDKDLQRIQNISHQITAVILRKQAEKQVHVQLQRLKAVSEIDHAITSSLDMHRSLDILLNQVLSQLGVDAASVLLLNSFNQTLEYVAGKGFRTLAIRQSRMRLGEGFPGWVGVEHKVLHISDLTDAGEPFIRAELLKDEEFVEYFCIFLVARGMLKGVLEIFHRAHLDPDLEWLNYLENLGGQAAIAIDNAQLFEGMQQSNLELVEAYDATITGWSLAMDLRDQETEGHTQRVTELTLKLAERMGISEHDQTHIRRGALLHDIGKLGVPDNILLKPGKLTNKEWGIMRQHPTYALNLLLPIAYLRPALDIPYCHHEKWDGSGYPRGLTGEQIPLSARIFAVVDVWDALRSDRPYRARWTVAQTLKYILVKSGTHFDPLVVDKFLGMIQDEKDAIQNL